MRNAGNERRKKGGNPGKEGFKNRGMLERRDAGKKKCIKGEIQERRNAGFPSGKKCPAFASTLFFLPSFALVFLLYSINFLASSKIFIFAYMRNKYPYPVLKKCRRVTVDKLTSKTKTFLVFFAFI